jgi:TonB-dependent receptor
MTKPALERGLTRSSLSVGAIGIFARSHAAVRVLFVLACGLFVGVSLLCAQTSGLGSVSGRVFNPATGEYVRNAEVAIEGTNLVTYTQADGSYSLANVPAGEVRVIVTYTGYEKAAIPVVVAAGQTAVRDFELKGASETVLKMGEFVVSSEREGNAKAIMEQRAAVNFKHLVASDNFGDITGGNIGEFIKYMPGVVIDYADADARTARIGGLDATYSAVTFDGARMATAASAVFSSTSRQFEFEQAAIASIDSIELNKTLTANLSADSAAGVINLRSKNAFERKRRLIEATGTLNANQYELGTRRVPLGDNTHRAIRPGFVFRYADVYRGRFGFDLNLSANSLYNEQAAVTHTYDTSNAARGPVVNTISMRDNPKITSRASAALNLDYKLLPTMTLSLRTQFSHFEDDIGSRLVQFVVNSAQVTPTSTVTNVTALATANINTRLQLTNVGGQDKFNDTASYVPKIEYRSGPLQVTAEGSYSRSRTHYEDRRSGYFAFSNYRLTRMSWSAQRSSARSTDWVFTQLSGRPWGDISSYLRDDAQTSNIVTAERAGQNQVWEGKLSGKYAAPFRIPMTFSAGVETRLNTYDLTRNGNLTWTYIGPSRNQLDPASVLPAHAKPGYFDNHMGGNAAALNIPIVDSRQVLDIYRAHPEYFAEDTIANFTALNTGSRAVKEQVDSGYAMLDSRWNRLRFNLGVRGERTRTVARNLDQLPAAQARAAGYTAGTIPYITYINQNFQKFNRYGDYKNTFFSGGVKYSLTKNLVLQLAGNQSIKRPSYSNAAGVVTVNEANQTVTVPNPEMKPETSDKYFASIQYYLEPAGTLSLSGYQLNVRDMGVSNTEVTAAEAGYADDPEYAGFRFLRPTNLTGTRKIKGVELEYSQQLVFLPSFARGFSVFGSLSRAIPDTRVASVVPKAANGGLRFSNHKFNLQLRATWTSTRLSSTTATSETWIYERLMFDLSGGYKFNDRYELTVSGRNIFNEPFRGYIDAPGLLANEIRYGANWTAGVRARF